MSVISKWKILWEKPISHALRRLFWWLQAGLWTSSGVVLDLLMRIGIRSYHTCCKIFRWSMVGNCCWHQWSTIRMIFLAWNMNTQITAPHHIGRLSIWKCWSVTVTSRSFLMKHLVFWIITNHITGYITRSSLHFRSLLYRKNNSYFVVIKPLIIQDLIKIFFCDIQLIPVIKGGTKYIEINI